MAGLCGLPYPELFIFPKTEQAPKGVKFVQKKARWMIFWKINKTVFVLKVLDIQ